MRSAGVLAGECQHRPGARPIQSLATVMIRGKRPVRHPVLVAIVGGSGAGKSWLADKLAEQLGRNVSRISQDDFYHDRSHLSPARRALINFDHPRAIDWVRLENVLQECRAGRTAKLPKYDFATHSHRSRETKLRPRRFILVDGLWLLRRPSVRQLFDLTVFIECPAKTCLARRLARVVASRGRTRASIQKQFWTTVEPMHSRFVAPQNRHADIVLEAVIDSAVLQRLSKHITALVLENYSRSRQPERPGGKAR